MDLHFTYYAKSTYTVEEITLIHLACEWFYEASQLESVRWTQMGGGELALETVKAILAQQSAPYMFGMSILKVPMEVSAVVIAVTSYVEFLNWIPPFLKETGNLSWRDSMVYNQEGNDQTLRREYYTRFFELNLILDKLKIDQEYLEKLSESIK